MRRGTLIGGLSAIAVAALMAAASPATAQQPYDGWYGHGTMGPGMMGHGMIGPGMMGPGMMGHGMMGPGMMGGYYDWDDRYDGYGHNMMGPGMMGWGYGPQANLNLSMDDVKGYLERWITMTGNPRLKVGPVTEKDSNTITADIVTTDKEALVQRFNIDRRTGFWQPAP